MAVFDGGSVTSDVSLLLLRQLDQRLPLFDRVRQPIPRACLLSGLHVPHLPVDQVMRPVVHRDTPAPEKVRAGIGRRHPAPDPMRHGRPDHLPGMVRLPMNSSNVFTKL